MMCDVKNNVQSRLVWLLVGGGTTAVVLSLLFLSAFTSHAASGGRVNYSGNPATLGGQSCGSCHSAVDAATPEVWIEGPTAVVVGDVLTYTLVISGGPAVIGGFNVSASGGLLQAIPSLTTTQTLNNFLGRAEVTHTFPPPNFNEDQTLTFPFRWHAAGTGEQTLYGAGLSANGSGDSSGDTVQNTVLAVQVTPMQLYLPLISRQP